MKDQQSIETKIFRVLKEIGVELSSYHSGSLNGKVIRKVEIWYGGYVSSNNLFGLRFYDKNNHEMLSVG